MDTNLRMCAAVLAVGIAAGMAWGAGEPGKKDEPGDKLKKIGESVVDPTALVYARKHYGYTPNAVANHLSAMATHGGWQYTTWYDGQRRLSVGRRKLPDGPWEAIHFEDYKHRQNDTHNTAEIGICAKDGTIHLAFDHHGHPLHYRVSQKSVAAQPGEVKWEAGLFGPVTSKLRAEGRGQRSVTYPCFFAAPEGKLMLLWRRGGSGHGDWILAEYDGESGDWTILGTALSKAGMYAGSKSRCAYPNGIEFDSKGRLHLSWCWRETPNVMTCHDVCYAYSDDKGRTWLNSAGQQCGETGKKPIRVDTPGITIWKIGQNRGVLNTNGQAVDSKGRVHVVTMHLPPDAPDAKSWGATRAKHYFHYWRDLDGTWHQNAIDRKTAFGNRPKLRLDGQDTLYLVYRTVKVVAATAGTRWKDWTVVYKDPGAFVGEPVIDFSRLSGDHVLSVYAQRKGKARGQPAPLCVLDLGPWKATK